MGAYPSAVSPKTGREALTGVSSKPVLSTATLSTPSEEEVQTVKPSKTPPRAQTSSVPTVDRSDRKIHINTRILMSLDESVKDLVGKAKHIDARMSQTALFNALLSVYLPNDPHKAVELCEKARQL